MTWLDYAVVVAGLLGVANAGMNLGAMRERRSLDSQYKALGQAMVNFKELLQEHSFNQKKLHDLQKSNTALVEHLLEDLHKLKPEDSSDDGA